MNKDRPRKKVLDDNEKCEILSSSISKMISTSENPAFINECHHILQTENKTQMKNTLKDKFMEATNKKSENSSSSNSQELDDSLNAFLQSAGNIFAYEDELEGFADWDKL